MSNYDQTDSLVEKRAIICGRVSTEEQARTPSVLKQLDINRHFCKKEGMLVVDQLRMEGMSASSHDHEPLLRRLISRKEDRNDFDVLVFMDYDRFSRDIRAGRRLWDDFLDAGVEIISATEPRAIGEMAFLQQDMALFKGQSYVTSFAKHTSTGWNQAVADGRLLPVTNVIYGVDKLFFDPSGQMLFILRDLHDGRKVKMNPINGSIIEYIVMRKGEKAVLKRKSEIIRPIPGNPALVKIVRDIFRWKHVEKWSVWKIGTVLNERKIPSPHGKDWCNSSINQMLMNTMYTGTCIGYRRSYSKFLMRGASGPVVHRNPRKKIKGMKGYKLINRPMSDWKVIEVPEMTDFLDADIREIAKQWQWERLKAREVQSAKRKVLNSSGRASGGNRHDMSKYILSGKIRSKQGDYAMKGWSRAGTAYKKIRYYVIGRFLDIAVQGDPRRRMVNAELVENKVLEALAETLQGCEGLDRLIAKHINEYAVAKRRDRQDLSQLKAELAEVNSRARILYEELTDSTRELFKEKAEQLASRRKELMSQVEATSFEVVATPQDIEKVTRTIKSQFRKIGKTLQERKLPSIRQMVDVFVHRCVADLETMQVDIDFAVPGWGMGVAGKQLEEACLVDSRSGSDFHQTHSLRPLIFEKYRLSHHFKLSGAGSKAWFTRERLPMTAGVPAD